MIFFAQVVQEIGINQHTLNNAIAVSGSAAELYVCCNVFDEAGVNTCSTEGARKDMGFDGTSVAKDML